jgi:hypothetical protein
MNKTTFTFWIAISALVISLTTVIYILKSPSKIKECMQSKSDLPDSCKDCEIVQGMAHCKCRKDNPLKVEDTKISLTCPYFISNCDGKLTCGACSLPKNGLF